MARLETTKLPPYGPYSTFKQALLDMSGSVVPSRLDSTYWGGGKSGATQAALNTAFRFFGFVNDLKETQPKLKEVVATFANDKQAFNDTIFEAYRLALDKIEDLDSATLGQLNEAFRSTYSMDGDMLRKAVTFFVNALTDAGMEVSPWIAKKTKGGSGVVKVRTRQARRKGRPRTTNGSQPAADEPQAATALPTVAELLLEKLPDFDPDWSEETKQKWFEALRDLKTLLQEDRKT